MAGKASRRIDRAIDERWLVRIRRAIPRAGTLDGLILTRSKKWTLVATAEDVRLNGFVAVRTRDIVKVSRRPRSLTKRYLSSRGLWPVPGPDRPIGLDCLRTLLDDATRAHGLVAVHTEREDPSVCFIGQVVGHRKRSFGLQEVTPKPKWKQHATKYRYRHVTRVDFGDAYCRALIEIAGPPPPDS